MEFKYNFRLEDFQPTTRRTVEHTLASYEKQYVHFLFMSETDKLFKFREGRLRFIRSTLQMLRYYLDVYEQAAEERKNAKVIHMYPRADYIVEDRLRGIDSDEPIDTDENHESEI